MMIGVEGENGSEASGMMKVSEGEVTMLLGIGCQRVQRVEAMAHCKVVCCIASERCGLRSRSSVSDALHVLSHRLPNNARQLCIHLVLHMRTIRQTTPCIRHRRLEETSFQHLAQNRLQTMHQVEREGGGGEDRRKGGEG